MHKIIDFIYYLFLLKVPISQIRTEITKTSIRDGWADKPISNLPIYPFFKLYIDGHKDEALNEMTAYYFNIAIDNKAIYIDKKDGGMKYGSTFQAISKLHKDMGIVLNEDLSNLDLDITKTAIQNRIFARFRMIDSIIKNGYSPSCQLIHAKSNINDIYHLTDGHHRVATMDILGYKTIPLAVNKPWSVKKIRRLLRTIHPRC
jgi:hypothetical protein